MARNLADLSGTTIAVSGTNPYGTLKDAPSGTVVDAAMIADMWVFFQRLMALAGIVLNGNADNNTNTFQLWVAFQLWVNPPWQFTGVVFENSGDNLWDNAGGSYAKFQYRVVGNDTDGVVFFCGVMENSASGSPISPLIMNLPAAIRPKYTMVCQAWEDLAGGGTPSPVQIEIRTNGDVVPRSTGTGGTLVYFEGVSYRLGLNTY